MMDDGARRAAAAGCGATSYELVVTSSTLLAAAAAPVAPIYTTAALCDLFTRADVSPSQAAAIRGAWKGVDAC